MPRLVAFEAGKSRGIKPLPPQDSRRSHRRRRGFQLGRAFAEENTDKQPVEPKALDRIAAVEAIVEFAVDDLASGGEFGASFLVPAQALRRKREDDAGGGGARGVGSGVRETSAAPLHRGL